MTYEEFKSEMEAFRTDAIKEGLDCKDSYLVLERLHSLYEKFDVSEQLMANHVIVDWALSEKEDLRFDALALISEFKIRQTVPALRELAERLRGTHTPGAPFELKKVHRIIGELTVTPGS